MRRERNNYRGGFAGLETLVVMSVLVVSIVLGINSVRNDTQDTRNFAYTCPAHCAYGCDYNPVNQTFTCRTASQCGLSGVYVGPGGSCCAPYVNVQGLCVAPTRMPTPLPTQPPRCNSGEYRCNNNSREQCNSGNWIVTQECQHGCDSGTASCKPAPTGTDCRTNGCGNNRACLRIDGIWQCVRHTPTPTRRPTNTPIPDCRSQGCSGASSCLPQDGRFVCVAHTPTPTPPHLNCTQTGCPDNGVCVRFGSSFQCVNPTRTPTVRPSPTITRIPTQTPLPSATPTPYCSTQVRMGCASAGFSCVVNPQGGNCGPAFTPTPSQFQNCIQTGCPGNGVCVRLSGAWFVCVNPTVAPSRIPTLIPSITPSPQLFSTVAPATNLGVGSSCTGDAGSGASRQCAPTLRCPPGPQSLRRCIVPPTSVQVTTATPAVTPNTTITSTPVSTVDTEVVIAGNSCVTWEGAAVGQGSCDYRYVNDGYRLHKCNNGVWQVAGPGQCNPSLANIVQPIIELPYITQRTNTDEMIRFYGCGPVSVAMIASTVDSTINVNTMVSTLDAYTKHPLTENGSTVYVNMLALRELGFNADVVYATGGELEADSQLLVSEIENYLANGWYVLVGGNFTTNGDTISHFSPVIGANGSHVVLNDPFYGPETVWNINESIANGSIQVQSLLIAKKNN